MDDGWVVEASTDGAGAWQGVGRGVEARVVDQMAEADGGDEVRGLRALGDRSPAAPKVSSGITPYVYGGGFLAVRVRFLPPEASVEGGRAAREGAGDFFQCDAYRLGDQPQASQVTHRGQGMGGVGALGCALVHQAGLLEAGQCEVEEAVSKVVFGETVSEVGQHAVVEAGVVQLRGHGVLEVDAAADRLGGLPVGQGEQGLQHTDGGRLSK